MKKIVDKFEFFVGPGLGLNYGNMFVENFGDGIVTNKRLAKLGYSVGFGLVKDLSKRLELNARFQYDLKGSKDHFDFAATHINLSKN